MTVSKGFLQDSHGENTKIEIIILFIQKNICFPRDFPLFVLKFLSFLSYFVVTYKDLIGHSKIMGNLPVPRDVSTSFTVVSNLLEQAYNMEDQWNEK